MSYEAHAHPKQKLRKKKLQKKRLIKIDINTNRRKKNILEEVDVTEERHQQQKMHNKNSVALHRIQAHK